mgnify:CR=1 FL=1
MKKVVIFLTGQTITTFGSFLVQYAIMWHLTLTTKSGLVLALPFIAILKVVFDNIDSLKHYGYLLGEAEIHHKGGGRILG